MGLLAMAMLYSGMRKGEALAIDIDRDIDFENGYIHIRKAIRNEAGKSVLSKQRRKLAFAMFHFSAFEEST